MKKVYLGYECYYNFCDVFETVTCVFDCEVKALIWKEQVEATDHEWRSYREFEVQQ